MITKEIFADYWSRIYSKASLVIKQCERTQTEFILFAFEKDLVSFEDLTKMAEIMNTDPLFIQAVKKTTGKTPKLQAAKTGQSSQLHLKLS